MMPNSRTAYQLSQSQVSTPQPIVSLFWKLASQHRKHFSTVLDLGAGDGRFARDAQFDKYVGIEIDRRRARAASVPQNGTIIEGCAFRHKDGNYDACVGNPPYVRHHDIQSPWKEETLDRLKREMAISLNGHCNLYIYFFCLALLKTQPEGLVGLVIPYEWVSRPSAKGLREYIQRERWNVAVYRFQMPIFGGVMTTASISIVDKSSHDSLWEYFDITPEHNILARTGIASSPSGVLNYDERGSIWGLRGLSPGSQKIFTLTEGQRIHAGLSKRDVVPCVTTLKNVPNTLRNLTKATFNKHFVQAGERCWLILSNRKRLSRSLRTYLASIPEDLRNNYTCHNQDPWYNYTSHPTPQVLFSSGFTKFGPKVLINSVCARTVGSVWGIHSDKALPLRRLQEYLLGIDFEAQVVAHAEKLKKVEVRQLNSVLNHFVKVEQNNAR